jgi:hypothetical protein
MLFKTLPELEFAFNKSTDIVIATMDYQAKLFTDTLEYFNSVTDRMFYTYTVKAAESVNNVTEYAKENITTGKKKVANIFGDSK